MASLYNSCNSSDFTFDRLPKKLQGSLRSIYTARRASDSLPVDQIHQGDAAKLLPKIAPNSVALSVWSPPYFVGKSYEKDLSFEKWEELLRTVITAHWEVIKPGGFLVINIADILCFRDPLMPKISAENVSKRRSAVTKEMVLESIRRHPGKSRYQLAKLLKCSEQTVDRRLNGNNIRGGKYETQTRLKIVGGLVEQWASDAGFYPYDRRVWVKDPCWENSKWASLSFRSVDEFEYIYIFWKPGVTTVRRTRLTPSEWRDWGSRGVWEFPSVRANDDHEAKFPEELPRRAIKLLSDPGDLVLDCFIGSGTTAAVAVELGRHYVGIELDDSYASLARRRVAQALKGVEEGGQCSSRSRNSAEICRGLKK